jgi:hypothetical protein
VVEVVSNTIAKLRPGERRVRPSVIKIFLPGDRLFIALLR